MWAEVIADGGFWVESILQSGFLPPQYLAEGSGGILTPSAVYLLSLIGQSVLNHITTQFPRL